ncbi:MAG TPA: NUDIX domain-containing protein [Balneolales bacterium]|nr:NUDIX domain-containing protein [Balneolales bacterium]
MTDKPFADRVRVRINGLIVRDRSLLMVKMKAPTSDKAFWIPPGGGLEFGESMQHALIREMKEETGLKVKVNDLRYTSEYINPPWHAVEFYFDCELIDGEVILGKDPELTDKSQYLKDISFIPFEEFEKYNIVPLYLKNHFVKDFLSGNSGIQFFPWKGNELRT